VITVRKQEKRIGLRLLRFSFLRILWPVADPLDYASFSLIAN
jgi:hypothetical protein